MQLVFNDFLNRFEFYCAYEERMIPKAAGFNWDAKTKTWFTIFSQHADTLLNYANDECKGRLNGLAQTILDDTKIPCPIGKKFYPHQEDGIRFCLAKPAVLLADEMGVGKTPQAIGVINASPAIKNVLVIVPASLKLNWQREFEKWMTRKLPVRILHSKSMWYPTGIVIMNYDIVGKFPVAKFDWDLLICDEGHYLKSSKSARTRTVTQIPAKKKILLTGTPILNRPQELWTLIHYLEPDVWKGHYGTFMSRYCAGYGSVGKGASNLAELHQRLQRTIMLRRTKKDVLKDLPPKRRVILEIPADDLTEMLKDEIQAYQDKVRVVRDLRIAMKKAKEASDLQAYRKAVLELGQGTQKTLSDISIIRHRTALAKVPYIVQHVNDALEETDKVVVFAHHKDVINKIVEAFPGQAVKLVGDMNNIARQKSIDMFMNDPNTTVFVGSIRAAGVGITLTSSALVIFAELDWVPGVMSQCEDRCHRIGQKESLLVQHIVLSGSLDAYMSNVLVRKQDILDQVLDGHPPVFVEDDILTEVGEEIAKR